MNEGCAADCRQVVPRHPVFRILYQDVPSEHG